MLKRSLLSVLAFAFSASTASAMPDPGEPMPRDAPAECVAPVNGTGLATNLANGPVILGRYRIANGKSVTTPKLKISAYGQFIPDRVGATTGEVSARFSAELVDKNERLPTLSENEDVGFAPGDARVGPYRVTLKVVTNKPLVYEATVERVGCEASVTHKPLATGEVHTFWMSTNAMHEMRFSEGNWFDNDPVFFITFSAGLAPRVQQTDMKHPRGYASMEAGNGSIYPGDSATLMYDKFAEGSTFSLHDYKVEIVKIVFGKDTVWKDGSLTTSGSEPTVHVLVRVTKLAPPPVQ